MKRPVFQIMARGILFCLYSLTFFHFIPVFMHSLKLGCITDVSEEYAFSCRVTHRLFFQYSGTKIIYSTQFIRNKILFPIFHVISFLYCFTLKMKTGSSFETSGTFDQTIRHIAGYLNLYLFPLSDRHIGISV
jgi:hypothetical protein